MPKIFSVVRDDRHSHSETGIGLWLIANGTVDAGDPGRPDRLFNTSDPEGIDLERGFKHSLQGGLRPSWTRVFANATRAFAGIPSSLK